MLSLVGTGTAIYLTAENLHIVGVSALRVLQLVFGMFYS